MNTGVIKFFNAGKNFGFVTPDGGGADIFLPGAAVAAAGLKSVKPGQRVRFNQAPDVKGPKIVALEIVGESPGNAAVPATDRVIVFCDSSTDIAADVVEAVRASGLGLTIHDYVTTPLRLDQVKRLSDSLRKSGQSLVRRYDPLFLELQLDDRFITDHDFWTAIVEHPGLINNPVLVIGSDARLCKTAADVRAFLNTETAAGRPKSKTLSPRLAAMLSGKQVLAEPAPPEPAAAAPHALKPAAQKIIRLEPRAAEAKKKSGAPEPRVVEPKKKPASLPKTAGKKKSAKKPAAPKPKKRAKR